MKKIGVFFGSFHIGGVQKVFITLLNEWKRQGYDVVAITLDATGELKEELDSSIQVIDLKVNRLSASFMKIPKVLRLNRIDVLLTGKDTMNLFFLFNKLLFRYKTKIFVSQHNFLTAEQDSLQGFYHKFILRGIRKLYKRAEGVVCVSKGVRNALVGAGVPENKITVIYNPLDMDKINEMVLESASLPNAPYVMFCGRFSPVKNLSYLINSFHIFSDSKPEYKLLLVGNGAEKQNLINLVKELKIEDKVIFTGAVSNPYPYLKDAELQLLTSLNEAFSMVVLEALALGKTVVTTSSGGPDEILQGEKGYIVDSFSDSELFAKTMLHAIDNRIDDNLLKEYAETFSKEVIAKQYIELFEK